LPRGSAAFEGHHRSLHILKSRIARIFR
jgi:hypothetical protein